MLKHDSNSYSFWSNFWGQVRHYTPFWSTWGANPLKNRGVKKESIKRCSREIRVTLVKGGEGPLNQYNQRIQRPTMDPLTLHFVPWGHGGGYGIYIQLPCGRAPPPCLRLFFAEPVYRHFFNLSLSLLQEHWRLWYNVIT